MKLQKYLTEYISDKKDIMDRNEDKDLDNTLTLLERDCKKFINETGGFLYRGTNRKMGDIIRKMEARSDRKPVDTSPRVHQFADKAFKKRFGWKVRSEGLFTATKPAMTTGYGANRYLVFPIGDYKYVWSKEVYDFFIIQSNIMSTYQLNPDTVKYEHIEEIVDMYHDKLLKYAWSDRQSREVILHCPNGYYYVNTLAIGELSYYLKIER